MGQLVGAHLAIPRLQLLHHPALLGRLGLLLPAGRRRSSARCRGPGLLRRGGRTRPTAPLPRRGNVNGSTADGGNIHGHGIDNGIA
jgi:hypothetical protein